MPRFLLPRYISVAHPTSLPTTSSSARSSSWFYHLLISAFSASRSGDVSVTRGRASQTPHDAGATPASRAGVAKIFYFQISSVAFSCARDSDGVFSVDTLPDRPLLLVCNTDPSCRAGRHSVAICVKEGRGEYFDAFGRRPSAEFERYMNRHCRYCRAVGTSCCLPIGWQQLGVAFPPGCYTSRERSRVVVGGCMVRVWIVCRIIKQKIYTSRVY